MKTKHSKKKLSTSKKILIGVLSFFTVIILSTVVIFNYFSSKVNRVEVDRTFVTNTGKEPAKEDKHVITIALFGSDYSGEENGAADSTMILALDTKNNKVKLMSLMRDMYLDLPDMPEKMNLNYTMVHGGPEYILKTINYNFNLQVDKFIHVNLQTLPIIIDSLGGVELTLSDEELPYVNGLIQSIDSKNGSSTSPVYSSGTQVLNGTQAAAYARVRSTAGGDYMRTDRQREVLNALFNKFKNISITELPGIINDLLPLVSTNMSNTEMISIGSKALGMGLSEIEQARFPLDQHLTTEWTDMYHMIIDTEATTNEIHKFIYSKE